MNINLSEITDYLAKEILKKLEPELVRIVQTAASEKIKATKPTVSATRFASVKRTAELFPDFPQGGLRNLIFNKEYNGFLPCVKKVGKKVLIDLDKFEDYITNTEMFKKQYGKKLPSLRY